MKSLAAVYRKQEDRSHTVGLLDLPKHQQPLCLLAINDIILCEENVIKPFADDTNLFFSDKTLSAV